MEKLKKILDNKILKFIIGTIKVVVLTILVLYVAFILFQRFGNNKSIFGYKVFTVATGSMEPVYNVNDVIVVEDVDPNKLKIGDDVVYKGNRSGLEGLIITHRIIKIEEKNDGSKIFFTKGVNNKNPDPSIDSSQIMGKVKGKLLFISPLNHLLKNDYVFFFLVFCPLTIVIIFEIIETIIETKLENNKICLREDIEKSSSEENGSDDEDEII